MATSTVTSIAYYLGQYHPLVENDAHWGEGFTEWHKVAMARPLFPGHLQPVLPGRLGFYDLRSERVIADQMRYAQTIGIDAFCYWHYWFGGKRVLHRPLDLMMGSPITGPKIMLGWANESWTGVWHGLPGQTLIEQNYGEEELRRHARLLTRYLRSDRYLRLGSLRPFLIYKPNNIPNASCYLGKLRELVRSGGGGDLYIIGTWGPGRSEQVNSPTELGLDAVVANNVGLYRGSRLTRFAYNAVRQLRSRLKIGPELRKYNTVSDTLAAARQCVDGVVHSSIVTGWDNTPRMGRAGLVLTGYDEDNFRNAIWNAAHSERKNDTRLLFIKSWNEWAEGNTLEPKFGATWDPGEVLSEVLRECG
jgi:hypothetical protein